MIQLQEPWFALKFNNLITLNLNIKAVLFPLHVLFWNVSLEVNHTDSLLEFIKIDRHIKQPK